MTGMWRQSFYRFQLHPKEVDFVLRYAPMVAEKETVSPVSISQRVKMVQRILSQDTASDVEAKVAKRSANDTLEIVRTIKLMGQDLMSLKKHSDNNKNDKNAKRKVQDCINQQRNLMKVLKKRSPMEYMTIKNEMSQ